MFSLNPVRPMRRTNSIWRFSYLLTVALLSTTVIPAISADRPGTSTGTSSKRNETRAPTLPAEVSAPQKKAVTATPAKSKPADLAHTSTPARPLSNEKIRAAARKLATNPNLTLAATRSAATDLIAANPVDFSGMPVEDAIALILIIMSEDANHELKDMLSAMDQKRASNPPPRDPAKTGKSAQSSPKGNEVSEAENLQINRQKARKAQLENLLSEALQKTSSTKSQLAENLK
jgi:hypothetical protein